MILNTANRKQYLPEVSKRREKSRSEENTRREASTHETRFKLLYHHPGASLGHHTLAPRTP